MLTIITNRNYQDSIIPFLLQFPSEQKLKHLRLLYSQKQGSRKNFEGLEYEGLLRGILKTSPLLTRLFFFNFQPNPLLIESCADRLTRLNLGYIHPNLQIKSIPLPPHLEVLFFPPRTALLFLGDPPPTLRVLIVRAEDFTLTYVAPSQV